RGRIDVGPHPLGLVALELEDLDRAAAIDAAAAVRLVLPLRHHDVALGDEVAQPKGDPLGEDSRQQLMAHVVPALEAAGDPGRAGHLDRVVLGLVRKGGLVVAAVVRLVEGADDRLVALAAPAGVVGHVADLPGRAPARSGRRLPSAGRFRQPNAYSNAHSKTITRRAAVPRRM